MRVYIDLDGLDSLAKLASEESIKELLRKHFDMYFTFPKDDILRQKKETRSRISNFLKTLSQGRVGDNFWNHECPIKVHTDYADLNEEELSSVYILSDKADFKKVQGGLLISDKGSERDTLRNLFIEGKPISTKTYNIRNMTSWRDCYGVNASPCCDIIIVDPYIFSDSDYLYENNVYSLIDELSVRTKDTAINIVFFAYTEYSGGEIPRQTIIRNIKERILKQLGKEPNVTIVKLPTREEHDRMIFSNYKMFISGDSFNYFGDKMEKRTHGRWMVALSLVDKDNYEISRDLLKDLQRIISDREITAIPAIFGDKVCNYLQFNK